MIEINLLPGPKRKKRGVGIAMPDFGAIAASVKDPLLVGVVVVWGLAAAVIAGVWYLESSQLNALRPEVSAVRSESRNYAVLIAEKRRMEILRDSLILELEAIREIDADRYVWPHIMDEVARAVPDFTWLVNLDNVSVPPPLDADEDYRPPVRFTVEGRTSDIQAYTRFVRRLEDSPWLADIQMGATQTVVEQDRQVTSFQIQGTFVQADSAFVRTVPVTEAAR